MRKRIILCAGTVCCREALVTREKIDELLPSLMDFQSLSREKFLLVATIGMITTLLLQRLGIRIGLCLSLEGVQGSELTL